MMRMTQAMADEILDADELRQRIAEDLARLSTLLRRGLWSLGRQAIRDAKDVQEGREELRTGLTSLARRKAEGEPVFALKDVEQAGANGDIDRRVSPVLK